MVALVNFGPITVSLKVYDDLLEYEGGIYIHTGRLGSTALNIIMSGQFTATVHLDSALRLPIN